MLLSNRLKKYYGCGVWAGKLFCILAAICYIVWRVVEWLYPRDEIEIAVDFPFKSPQRHQNKQQAEWKEQSQQSGGKQYVNLKQHFQQNLEFEQKKPKDVMFSK